MEKAEFEPRVIRARERLSRFEADSRVEEERRTAEQELRLVIGQLEAFAGRVQEGLGEADWRTRREVIRALVKRVEIDESEVRVVYKIRPAPFVEGPERGRFQDRVRRSVVRSWRLGNRAIDCRRPRGVNERRPCKRCRASTLRGSRSNLKDQGATFCSDRRHGIRVTVTPALVERWRFDRAGADGIDADLAAPEIHGPAARERPHGGVSGAVDAERLYRLDLAIEAFVMID
jgi:hypothetical protein